MNAPQHSEPLPNNFGATLLIIIGMLSLPGLIGIPVLVYGLSELRTREGRRSYASLRPWS